MMRLIAHKNGNFGTMNMEADVLEDIKWDIKSCVLHFSQHMDMLKMAFNSLIQLRLFPNHALNSRLITTLPETGNLL